MSSKTAFKPYVNRESVLDRIATDDGLHATFAAEAAWAVGDPLTLVVVNDNTTGFAAGTPTYYTIQQPGRYHFEVALQINDVKTSTWAKIYVVKDPAGAATVQFSTDKQVTAATTLEMNGSSIIDCNVGDIFEVRVGSSAADAASLAGGYLKIRPI